MKPEPMTVGFIFTHDLSFVLLIRKNHPDWQKGLLNGVGGHVKASEFAKGDYKKAWVRKVRQETNLVVPINKVIQIGRIVVLGDRVILPVYAYKLAADGFPETKQMTDEPIDWYAPLSLIHHDCHEDLHFFVPFARYVLRYAYKMKDSSRIELHYKIKTVGTDGYKTHWA